MAESEKVQDISNVTVSASVLGRILGVTDRRVRALAQEGLFSKAAQGRYYLQESIHNYIVSLRVANDALKPELEDELVLETEKAKHERIKRHMSELKYSRMKGDSHKSSDVERVMTNMLVNFKSKILALPSKLTPQLTHKDKVEVEKILTEAVTETLIELSDYNAEDFYSEEFVGIDDEELDNE